MTCRSCWLPYTLLKACYYPSLSLSVLTSQSFFQKAISWLAEELWSSPPQRSLVQCWPNWWHLGLRRPSPLMEGSLWASLEEALCPCLAKSCPPCQTWTAASGWWASVTSGWFPLMILRAPMGYTRYFFRCVLVCPGYINVWYVITLWSNVPFCFFL